MPLYERQKGSQARSTEIQSKQDWKHMKRKIIDGASVSLFLKFNFYEIEKSQIQLQSNLDLFSQLLVLLLFIMLCYYIYIKIDMLVVSSYWF